MLIKYFDVNSIQIDDLSSIDYFYKVYYDDNFYFLKIETYENNELINLNYFVKNELFLNQIFEEYHRLDVITISFIIETKGKYLMCESFEYINKIKQQNRRIETYRNDLILPIYLCQISEFEKKENKYHYDTERNIEYEFDYDEKGEFERLTIYDVDFFYDTDNYTLYPEDIGIGKNHLNFSFNNFDFYRKVKPTIPLE